MVPMGVELEAGKNYAWCACGKSSKQPFCDGTHKGSGMVPVIFQVEESRKYHLCMCKQTNKPGFCDGTHKSL